MKNFKKIFGLMLAMIMVLAMSITAFADDTTKLTINAATGHTYYVYQMLTGDVSALKDGEGTLANVKAGDDLKFSNQAGETEDDKKAAAVAAFDAAIKDADGNYLTGTDLSKAAIKFVDNFNDPTAIINAAGNSADVAPGYYVVKDVITDGNENEYTAYMVAVVGPTTMSPKSSTPDLDKNIIDTDANKALEGEDATSKKTDTAAIGDTIEYELTSAVPVTEGYKYYYYVVNDTLSKGLTLDEASFEVTIGTGETAKTLEKGAGKDYNVYVDTADANGNVSFRLAIFDLKGYDAGLPISIKYNATVNKDAEIGLDPNTNTVYLQYSNNPSDTFDKEKSDKPNEPGVPDESKGFQTGETPTRITKTYVTQLTIQKTDETGAFIDALKGATFTLTGTGLNDVKVAADTVFVVATGDEVATHYLLKDGTYTTTDPVTEGDDKTVDSYAETEKKYVMKTIVSCTTEESGAECNITAVVNADGQIVFTGLNAGKYTLEETNVPVGYNKAADIKFEITADQVGETTTFEGTAIDWKSDNTKVSESMEGDKALGVFATTIENKKGNTLPSTGGIGTTLFYLVGAVLVLGAGVVLVARKRAR